MRGPLNATVHSAAAYRWQDRVVLHPQSQTTAGFWIQDRPITTLLPIGPTHELGSAVLRTLRCSRSRISVPDYKSADWTALQREVWAAAGQRSLRGFMANACYVGLQLSSGVLILEATRNGGVNGLNRGFKPLLEATLELAAPTDPETVGNALSTAWSCCQ